MCRIISFVSGVGGIGKTSIIYELGVRLSKNNYKVCLIDGYFNNNSLSLKFDRQFVDFKEYIIGKSNFESVCNLEENLSVIKTNIANFDYNFYFDNFIEFINKAKKENSYILIDINCFQKDVMDKFLKISTEVFCILDNKKNNVIKSFALCQKIKLFRNISNLKLVINKYSSWAEIKRYGLSVLEIEDILKLDVLFVIECMYKNNYFNYINITKKNKKVISKFYYSFITNSNQIINYKKKYKGIIGFIKLKVNKKYE